MKRTIWHELALLFSGAFASVIGSLWFKSWETKTAGWLIFLVFLLVIYGSGLLNYLIKVFLLKTRHFFDPKIGVLNDINWEGDFGAISSWTDILPQVWVKKIKAQLGQRKIKIELVSFKKNFDKYICILNPYGGVYPETDTKSFPNLNKIFDYVNEGGFFVNVTDIPGYFAFLTPIAKRIDVTPPIYGIETVGGQMCIRPIRPFQLTPFMERLALQIINTEGKLF